MAALRTFTFLGTGTSVGVPMLGCACPTCSSLDPRNQRMRSSVLLTTERGRILIDTTPELRLQLLRAKVPFVHAVLLTHYHADHLHGFDDVRIFPKYLDGPLDVYCSPETEAVVRRVFSYAFEREGQENNHGFVSQVRFRNIEPGHEFQVCGETIVPIALEHSRFNVLGFRIGDVAYCTDVNRIPPESMELLRNLRVLVVDALRQRRHPAHFSLAEALEVIAELRPERAYLTHISHEMEFSQTSAQLPRAVEMAYDGLSFTF